MVNSQFPPATTPRQLTPCRSDHAADYCSSEFCPRFNMDAACLNEGEELLSPAPKYILPCRYCGSPQKVCEVFLDSDNPIECSHCHRDMGLSELAHRLPHEFASQWEPIADCDHRHERAQATATSWHESVVWFVSRERKPFANS